jgi:PAS domain S-box-containing protein
VADEAGREPPTPLELLRRVRAVTASVTAATTPDGIAAAALIDGLGVLGASAVLLRVAGTRDGDLPRAAAVPARTAGSKGRRPGPRPGTLIGTAGDADLVAALAAAAGNVRLSPERMPATGVHSTLPTGSPVVTLPLRLGRSTLGLLSACFADDPDLDSDLAQLHLTAVTDLCARQLAVLMERRRAETHAARLELALAGARMGTFDWDAESDRLYWSERLEEIFGLAPGTFEGTTEAFYQAVHPEDRERVALALQRARDTGGEFAAVHRIVRADGEIRWLDARGRFLSGSEGPATRLLGTALDVTDQRTSRDQLSLQVEQLADGFILFDDDLRFLYVNAAAERFLHHTRAELLGVPLEIGLRYVDRSP